MSVLLGVDAGHTLTKAALFDADGALLGSGARPTATVSRHPRWQERDMDATWDAAAAAIRGALADAGLDGGQVSGVGISGHGDGLYLLDQDDRPVRAAVLATDTRAADYCRAWATGPVRDRLLAVTGAVPAPYQPAATLSWLRDHEPDVFSRTRHLLFCKDWLRFCLTGRIATDPTDASSGLFDIRARTFSDPVADWCGIPEATRLWPPVLASTAIAGQVSVSAAVRTGVRAGTPVITGSHDVHATALGVGALRPGDLSAILGTFSINQLVSTTPTAAPRWQARCSVTEDRFLLMSTSPTGATAVDWLRQVTGSAGPLEWESSEAIGVAVAAALHDGLQTSDPQFLPFVYGMQAAEPIGGALVGLHSWHDTAALIRAGLEGVVFAHREHLAALRPLLPTDGTIRLAGGGSRSPQWCQLFADATGLTVEVADAVEAGARGVAMLTAVGLGLFPDVDAVARQWVSVVHRHEPDPTRADLVEHRYRRWSETIAALQSVSDDPQT